MEIGTLLICLVLSLYTTVLWLMTTCYNDLLVSIVLTSWLAIGGIVCYSLKDTLEELQDLFSAVTYYKRISETFIAEHYRAVNTLRVQQDEYNQFLIEWMARRDNYFSARIEYLKGRLENLHNDFEYDYQYPNQLDEDEEDYLW